MELGSYILTSAQLVIRFITFGGSSILTHPAPWEAWSIAAYSTDADATNMNTCALHPPFASVRFRSPPFTSVRLR
jgi:hypothetical protein